MSIFDTALAARDSAHFAAEDRGEALTEAAWEEWEKLQSKGRYLMKRSSRKPGKETFPCSQYYDEVTMDTLRDELNEDATEEQLFELFAGKLEDHFKNEANDEY